MRWHRRVSGALPAAAETSIFQGSFQTSPRLVQTRAVPLLQPSELTHVVSHQSVCEVAILNWQIPQTLGHVMTAINLFDVTSHRCTAIVANNVEINLLGKRVAAFRSSLPENGSLLLLKQAI
jgi:hypothetical protein